MTANAAFTIGCDPEAFVVNEAGKLVTAHGLIPGDKSSPHRVTAGAIQVDGMATEFNTDPVPANDFDRFDTNIITVIKQLKAALPAGHRLRFTPSAQFDEDYYASVPEAAKELGCDPDFCAYSADIHRPNDRPEGSSGLRSAAGHIHIGWTTDAPVDNPQHLEICRRLIRGLDCTVGMYMTTIDTDTERRKLYGRAGAYRPKSYGVEYRTPSNVWLQSQTKRRSVHSLVNICLTNLRAVSSGGRSFESLAPLYDYNIEEIINTGDSAQAKRFLERVVGFYS